MGSHGLLHQSKYLELDGEEKQGVGRICGMDGGREEGEGREAGFMARQGLARLDGHADLL